MEITEKYAVQRYNKWLCLAFLRVMKGQNEKASRAYKKSQEWFNRAEEIYFDKNLEITEEIFYDRTVISALSKN